MSNPYCCSVNASGRACLQPATWRITWSSATGDNTDSCNTHIANLAEGQGLGMVILAPIRLKPTLEDRIAEWYNESASPEIPWTDLNARLFLEHFNLVEGPDS